MLVGPCLPPRVQNGAKRLQVVDIAWARSSPLRLGRCVFLVPAMMNRFPFVFPDSVDYLIFTPREYRSPFYGLFIFFFHLNRFIWAPIIAQSFIVSHLIWVLVRIHAGTANIRCFGLTVVVLSVFSSLPFFAGFMMPDIFTSIMILVSYVLGFHFTALSILERFYFILLGCMAIAAHVSHLPQAVALALMIVVAHLVLQKRPCYVLSRAGLLSIPLALAAAAILLNNVVIHRTFALFPAGQSFLLANMIEHGPARRYLQEACPAAGYRICMIVDMLPATSYELLWSTDAYQGLGGFEGMREEAKQIVIATIRSRPWDVLDMAMRTIASSFVRHAPGAELLPLSNHYSMVDVLTKKFGRSTVRAYEDSRQSQGAIPRALLQAIDGVAFPSAVMAVLFAEIPAFRRGLHEATALAVLLSAAYVTNNALCAFSSGVFDRYQARITWLFALAALLIFFALARSTKESNQQTLG